MKHSPRGGKTPGDLVTPAFLPQLEYGKRVQHCQHMRAECKLHVMQGVVTLGETCPGRLPQLVLVLINSVRGSYIPSDKPLPDSQKDYPRQRPRFLGPK